MILLVLSSCGLAQTEQPPRPPSTDAVLNLYRDAHFRPAVIEFYTTLTESREVALAILEACDELGLPPSLAFALAWNESQFNPKAQHVNAGGTVDRGLFQLNSRTFPRMTRKVAFDPVQNARLGLSFYKKLQDQLVTPTKALGYYNAGIGLLTDRPLPRRTVTYIGRILGDQSSMDRDAIAWLYFKSEPSVALR